MIRIIGVGNPLRGDDGVAMEVMDLLQSLPLPEGVEIVDAGQAGLALVGLMADATHVVFIDAVDMGAVPGEIATFHLQDVLIAEDEIGCNIHNARTGTAIRMADALGCLPPMVTVVGIQPGQMEWRLGLSAEVNEAAPRAAYAIQALVLDQGEVYG